MNEDLMSVSRKAKSSTVLHNRTELEQYVNQLTDCGIEESIDFDHFALIELKDFEFPPYAEELLAAHYAELYRVIPLMAIKGVLVVAIADDVELYESIRNIEFVVGGHVEAVVAKSYEIDDSIDKLYSTEELVGLENEDSDEDASTDSVQELRRQLKEKPIVQVVRRMLLEAINKRASDIHIRPSEHGIDYLLRIDGNMTLRSEINKRHLKGIISRFKILGGMDISEHRTPQDGSAKISISGHVVELRFSIMPTIHGESLVVRLLNTDAQLFKLEQLGLTEFDYKNLLRSGHQSHGLVLITGPTGSGKSTTLYALLQEVKKNTGINIITVEDPVEFHIDDIEQIQINKKTGYTFPKALRNILRHDPDVIMVGEIRDEETAKMAIECALTGHLVLSTLHSVNTISTITRMLEMGVKPYLVKSTLSLVVAQRLAKLNCEFCKGDDVSMIAQNLNTESKLKHIHWYKSTGCKECHFTGLKGRIGLYESLPVMGDFADAIVDGVTEKELRAVAKQAKGEKLSDHAIALAEEGRISAEEFIRLQISV